MRKLNSSMNFEKQSRKAPNKGISKNVTSLANSKSRIFYRIFRTFIDEILAEFYKSRVTWALIITTEYNWLSLEKIKLV